MKRRGFVNLYNRRYWGTRWKIVSYSLAAACLALSAKSPMSAPIKLAKANNLLLSTQSLPKTNKIIDRPGHVKELCLSKQTTEFLGDLHTGLHYT